MTGETSNLREANEASLVERAGILMEAMPYIHQFAGATIVVKYGGHAMVDDRLRESVIKDIVLMELVGMNPIVVHGGGPDITRLMDRVGKKPTFIDGLRVTDRETMELTEMVLAGKLNGDLVSLVNRAGGRAVGLSGKDAGLFLASPLGTAEGVPNDKIGFVGELRKINPEILDVLDAAKFIPVISPIGVDEEGNSYNINADTAAAELAAALQAEKLILLTDVPGVQRDQKDPETLISRGSIAEFEALIADGTIQGGMIPKIQACIRALRAGVENVHILDGRTQHVLLLELFTRYGIGTMITK